MSRTFPAHVRAFLVPGIILVLILVVVLIPVLVLVLGLIHVLVLVLALGRANTGPGKRAYSASNISQYWIQLGAMDICTYRKL